MPDRLYMPIDGENYRRRDRLWAHWYAFCATFASVILGFLIVLSAILRAVTVNPSTLDPDHDGVPGPPWAVPGWAKWLNPAPSLAAIPEWQGVVVGLLLMIGGSLWMIATMVAFRYVEDFWKTLRAGLIMLALGWLAYVVCAVDQRPEWVVPWWIGLTHVFAYSGGFYISMVSQWRLKGYPTWAVRVSNRTYPIYTWVCRVFNAPFTLIEGHLARRSLTFDLRKNKGGTRTVDRRGGAGD